MNRTQYGISVIFFISLNLILSHKGVSQSLSISKSHSNSTLHQPSNRSFSETNLISEKNFSDSATVSVNDDITSTTSTSLTVGYLKDDYDLRTDGGSQKFKFDGNASALMLNSKASSLMLSYGTADAEEDEGKIRSITADLQIGGNATLFKKFFGLPVGGYIPIRLNLGYRNLHLMDAEDDNNSANIGSAGLGAGLGASIRIPTGLPLLQDNITGFVSLVKSVGAMGDLSTNDDNNGLDENRAISGVRLTQNTDFNLEGKFENLLGGNIGVTVGLTLRWMKWTTEGAEEFSEIFDVVSGKQENLEERGTQTLLRLGINW